MGCIAMLHMREGRTEGLLNRRPAGPPSRFGASCSWWSGKLGEGLWSWALVAVRGTFC